MDRKERIKLNRQFHRNGGYLIVGIVCFFAITGILLNHRSSLKIGYSTTVSEYQLDAFDTDTILRRHVNDMLMKIDTSAQMRAFQLNEDQLQIFINSGNVTIKEKNGEAEKVVWSHNQTWQTIKNLHMASFHSLWKWVSDFFALCLIFVAITGLYMAKGRNSFRKYGWRVFAVGSLIPILLVIIIILMK
ncbi:MAG: PepSY-associated TM helix domain-containing protein [Bacteroidales bacterium]|nr:PepSY-associated TM helix domain-containing protein [Bacteroidales bacterium]